MEAQAEEFLRQADAHHSARPEGEKEGERVDLIHHMRCRGQSEAVRILLSSLPHRSPSDCALHCDVIDIVQTNLSHSLENH